MKENRKNNTMTTEKTGHDRAEEFSLSLLRMLRQKVRNLNAHDLICLYAHTRTEEHEWEKRFFPLLHYLADEAFNTRAFRTCPKPKSGGMSNGSRRIPIEKGITELTERGVA